MEYIPLSESKPCWKGSNHTVVEINYKLLWTAQDWNKQLFWNLLSPSSHIFLVISNLAMLCLWWDYPPHFKKGCGHAWPACLSTSRDLSEDPLRVYGKEPWTTARTAPTWLVLPIKLSRTGRNRSSGLKFELTPEPLEMTSDDTRADILLCLKPLSNKSAAAPQEFARAEPESLCWSKTVWDRQLFKAQLSCFGGLGTWTCYWSLHFRSSFIRLVKEEMVPTYPIEL